MGEKRHGSIEGLSRDEHGRSNISEFKTNWRRRFSIQLLLPGSYSRLQEDISLIYTWMSFNSVSRMYFDPLIGSLVLETIVTGIT